MHASRQRLSVLVGGQVLSTNAPSAVAAACMSSASNASTPLRYSVPGFATDAQPARRAIATRLRGAIRAGALYTIGRSRGVRRPVQEPVSYPTQLDPWPFFRGKI